jgi:cation transport regulator
MFSPPIPAGAREKRRISEHGMPYRHNDDLPQPVRSHLSDHAQDIYREAFNHAFRELAGEAEREKRAHMIAWAAVKRCYIKADGDWVPR